MSFLSFKKICHFLSIKLKVSIAFLLGIFYLYIETRRARIYQSLPLKTKVWGYALQLKVFGEIVH
jgi:hypothetical protein